MLLCLLKLESLFKFPKHFLLPLRHFRSVGVMNVKNAFLLLQVKLESIGENRLNTFANCFKLERLNPHPNFLTPCTRALPLK